MSFTQFSLSAEILQAVTEQGYKTPTPIQQQAIPVVLAGRDILAGAQTGTGKTASFTLPLLQLLQDAPSVQRPRPIRCLVLVPTRELALQVYESIRAYGKHLPLFAEAIYGGVSITNQIRNLRRGCDIVVATPGRLLDHVQQKTIDLSQVKILVLDEADRMLDMGFIQDIRKVIALIPKKRQTLLFSATFSAEIKTLAGQLLNNPTLVEVARSNATVDAIAQSLYPIKREYKRELLSYLIGNGNWQQVLIFVRTKHGADRLAKQLALDGIKTAALHGDKSQGARVKALEMFKNGKVTALVATDIAARGLDIDQLPHVVNYDLPAVAEDYVHRIGRTGRAGATGEAISLVSSDEAKLLQAIEKLLKMAIPRVADTGYELESLAVGDMPKKAATTVNKPKPRQFEQRTNQHQPAARRGNGSADSRVRHSAKR
ncbi:MAG: DEAD/DEAH box helicase [Methylococcaceae bacterium]|nr:DEAD/DEAH box helicase [Methylococcaceae bacterium]